MSLVTFPPARPSRGSDAALLSDVGERLAGILASQRRLSRSPTIDFHARRRLEAVIAQLIEALDELVGEPVERSFNAGLL